MSQAAPAQHSAPAVSFDEQVLKEAQRVITDDAITPNQRLTHLLSMMIWHRSRLLQEYLLQNAHHNQIAVMGGVFEGLLMSLPIHAGIALPMILGSYESELHSAVRNAMRRGYQHVVNIGCGDGYYLVGMARHMKATQFFGYDVNPAAQQGCQQTANHNGVAERVTIGGLFAGADFAQHPAGETLVICDIEGAEDELLDPALYPALCGHDIIVELHEVYRPGITERLRNRFAATHQINFINHQAKRATLPPALQGISELDEYLCVYEGRGGATPWLVMNVK